MKGSFELCSSGEGIFEVFRCVVSSSRAETGVPGCAKGFFTCCSSGEGIFQVMKKVFSSLEKTHKDVCKDLYVYAIAGSRAHFGLVT